MTNPCHLAGGSPVVGPEPDNDPDAPYEKTTAGGCGLCVFCQWVRLWVRLWRSEFQRNGGLNLVYYRIRADADSLDLDLNHFAGF